jgi:dihydrofolate reductase
MEPSLRGSRGKAMLRQQAEHHGSCAPRRGARMATRQVIVQELVTVDGFVAGPSGELEFFEAVSDYSEVDQDNLSILGQVDTILLGSRTYRLFVDYWPTAEGELMAEFVNSTPKIVFSSKLDRAPWGRWEPARVRKGSAVDHVRQLRREPGRDVVVWGSISLAQSLLEAGMVDEIQLRVIPIMVGHGRTLLTEHSGRQDLTLLEAKPYASGIVSLRYAVTGADTRNDRAS